MDSNMIRMISAITAVFFTASASYASIKNIHPVITLAAGADMTSIHSDQTLTLISPFQNRYSGHHNNTDFVGGLFFGAEKSFGDLCSLQIGLGYYQNDNFQAQGTVYQFNNPNMGNLTYQYTVRSRRLFLEGKMRTTIRDEIHPFLNIGIGRAYNTTGQYNESAVTSDAVPASPGFRDRTTNDRAWFAGLGLEQNITPHVRIGALYRYVSAGQAELGTLSNQDSNNSLTQMLYLSEVMLQLSWVG